jgi:hydrogenase expression/formation protein HypD
VDNQFDVNIQKKDKDEQCICGKILRGLNQPDECPLFFNVCNPENPVGACMVSNEGACYSYYKYRPIL